MADKKHDTEKARPLGMTRTGMRLYADDDERIIALRKAIQDVSGDTMLDLIRNAVSLGLPLLEEKWKPIVEANRKAK